MQVFESIGKWYGHRQWSLDDRIQKILLSAFIILNLGTAIYMNLPEGTIPAAGRVVVGQVSPMFAYRVRYGGWLIQKYAHMVGLDNRWTMFAHTSRFNWWYVIKAEYTDSTIVVLPISHPGPQTLWQRWLFDFREAKLQLNLYPDEVGREAYARYLNRQYRMHGNAPIKSITWELHYQNILDPIQAGARGTHLEPAITTTIFSRYDYMPKVNQR